MVSAPTDLVIFDCDGVLVDSEPISMAVLVEMIGEAGREIGEDEAYERFLGKSLSSICTILENDFGVMMQPIHLEAMRQKLYGRFARELRAVPGIASALPFIRCRKCVASSSQLERIRLSLTVTGLAEIVGDHLFSASMVPHGKPAPDLFLHAAECMRVRPPACLVIEDSAAGVSAAKAAGMRVFAYVGASHAVRPDHLLAMRDLEPDAIFDDMETLPALIAA